MSYISSLATSAMALLVSASTPAYAPAKPTSDWILLGTSSGASHDVQKSSISWLREPLAVEFVFRTKYLSPKTIGGRRVTEIRERTLVLCNEDILVTMDQTQYDAAGKSTKFEQAVVYLNPDEDSNVVTATIEWACGKTPEYMKKPKAEEPELAVPKREPLRT